MRWNNLLNRAPNINIDWDWGWGHICKKSGPHNPAISRNFCNLSIRETETEWGWEYLWKFGQSGWSGFFRTEGLRFPDRVPIVSMQMGPNWIQFQHLNSPPPLRLETRSWADQYPIISARWDWVQDPAFSQSCISANLQSMGKGYFLWKWRDVSGKGEES